MDRATVLPNRRVLVLSAMLVLALCPVPLPAGAAESAGMTISGPGYHALAYGFSNPDSGVLITSSDVVPGG